MSDDTLVAHHKKQRERKAQPHKGPIDAVVTVDDANETIVERRVSNGTDNADRASTRAGGYPGSDLHRGGGLPQEDYGDYNAEFNAEFNDDYHDDDYDDEDIFEFG